MVSSTKRFALMESRRRPAHRTRWLRAQKLHSQQGLAAPRGAANECGPPVADKDLVSRGWRHGKLPTSIIELRCPAVGVAGDPLGDLQRSSVLQEIRDPCGPKGMGRECIRQSGVFEPVKRCACSILLSCRSIARRSSTSSM
jgi:hypothetical protein